MKSLRALLNLTCLALFLTLGAGCATSQSTESRLAASGFKVIPATSPEQKQQLLTLPSEKISVVKRNGTVYFVYPDLKQNLLYVGRDAQYDAYQNLLLNTEALNEEHQAEAAEVNASVMSSEATIVSNDPWAAFGVWPVGGAVWVAP